ncbi:MAG TPA: universal stress protein [Glaciihabitans sp.]|nr:universal stress protein [Glaciihabitans sp.]
MGRVVVAVDGGQASDSALDWAIELARTTPTELQIVTVYDSVWSPYGDSASQFRPLYESVLERAAERISRTAPQVRFTQTVRNGLAPTEIARASREADLLVLGTHKPTRMRGAVYGTLPLRVAATTHCPTVVVPVQWTPSAGPVVVGFDAVNEQPAAIRFAREFASERHRHLVVVHAWHIPPIVAVEMLSNAALWDSMKAAHHETLSREVAAIREADPRLTVRGVLKEGPAVVALLGEGTGASVLVVGRHGRGAVAGLLLGSTSHDVLLNMPCPVVVVPE